MTQGGGPKCQAKGPGLHPLGQCLSKLVFLCCFLAVGLAAIIYSMGSPINQAGEENQRA